jgi:hypothetical protein
MGLLFTLHFKIIEQYTPLLFGNSNIPAKERFLFRTVFVFENLPLSADETLLENGRKN